MWERGSGHTAQLRGLTWRLRPQRPMSPHLGHPPLIPHVVQHVLTSSRMQDLRRSRSSLVRDAWPWSLSARDRKRLGDPGSSAQRSPPASSRPVDTSFPAQPPTSSPSPPTLSSH